MKTKLNIICLETEAFYALINEVVERVSEKNNVPEKKWICGEETMELLGIKSDTTLRKLRNEGELKFSLPSGKLILYDRKSVDAYLERKSHDSFY